MSGLAGGALLVAPEGALRDAIADRLRGEMLAVYQAAPSELPDEAAWQQQIGRVEAETGSLRLLVHAVPGPEARLSETNIAEFERQFDSIVSSLWIGGIAAARVMRANAGGAIVVARHPVASLGNVPAGLAAMFGEGLQALADCMGVAFAQPEAGVRVVCVATSVAPAATAELVAFLGSDGASYVTATGVASQSLPSG